LKGGFQDECFSPRFRCHLRLQPRPFPGPVPGERDPPAPGANTLVALTGVSDPYEPPMNPEIVLRTAELSVDECVAQVLAFLRLA
jgi:hypothetical protein